MLLWHRPRQVCGNAGSLAQVIRWHSSLLGICGSLSGLVQWPLGLMTAIFYYASVVSTVQVVRGDSDPFCLPCVTYLSLLYVLMRAADKLEVASELVAARTIDCFAACSSAKGGPHSMEIRWVAMSHGEKRVGNI